MHHLTTNRFLRNNKIKRKRPVFFNTRLVIFYNELMNDNNLIELIDVLNNFYLCNFTILKTD